MGNEKSPEIKIWDNTHGDELDHMKTGRKLMARFCIEEGVAEFEAFTGQDFDSEVAAGRMSRFEYEHTDKAGRLIRDVFFTLKGEEWRAQASILVVEYLYTRGWCIEFDWLEARLFGLSNDDAARVAKAEWQGRGRTTDKFPDV